MVQARTYRHIYISDKAQAPSLLLFLNSIPLVASIDHVEARRSIVACSLGLVSQMHARRVIMPNTEQTEEEKQIPDIELKWAIVTKSSTIHKLKIV